MSDKEKYHGHIATLEYDAESKELRCKPKYRRH